MLYREADSGCDGASSEQSPLKSITDHASNQVTGNYDMNEEMNGIQRC